MRMMTKPEAPEGKHASCDRYNRGSSRVKLLSIPTQLKECGFWALTHGV